ncbi:undecaprenyl-diphosphate phosphatase [Kocuria rhizophila]|nr:undecaprenyl-diphosphate phosphatase [Kocuria rhizophila]
MAGHRAHHQALGALTDRAHGPRGPGCPDGLVHHPGSLPIGILGLLLQDFIETQLRSLWITATMLVLFGIFLAVADHVGKQERHLEDLTMKHRGGLRLRPGAGTDSGVSRSRWRRSPLGCSWATPVRPPRATRSCWPSRPCSPGTLQLYKVVSAGRPAGMCTIGQTAVATLIAFAVGYLIIGWSCTTSREAQAATACSSGHVALGALVFVLLGLGVPHPDRPSSAPPVSHAAEPRSGEPEPGRRQPPRRFRTRDAHQSTRR